MRVTLRHRLCSYIVSVEGLFYTPVELKVSSILQKSQNHRQNKKHTFVQQLSCDPSDLLWDPFWAPDLGTQLCNKSQRGILHKFDKRLK